MKLKQIVLVIIFIVLLFSLLIIDPLSLMVNNDVVENDNINKQVLKEIEEIENSEYEDIYLDYKNKNKDTVGYISIEEVNISYPIMSSNISNDYYLSKDYNNQDSIYGSIYLDIHNNGTFNNINMIHGHNVYNGSTMFTNLTKYKDENFYNNASKEITIYNGSEEVKYQIYTLNVIDSNELQIPVDYQKNTEWLKKAFNLSKVEYEEILKYEDILILNTCDYSFDEARLLVLAYKIS